MYPRYFKRFLDFLFSLLLILFLSPVILVLIISGTIAMRGNPFFTQLRPGKIDKKTGNEKIFKLIKFRTMNNKRDKNGNFLPDELRLNAYGRFLRKTSLDELMEFWNILIGDMSFVGPRPLLVEYLPYYTEEERHRHDVRPGLTGWAQVNGRNSTAWDKRFKYDTYYVNNVSFLFDVKIIIRTITVVLSHKDVHENTQQTEGNLATIRKNMLTKSEILK